MSGTGSALSVIGRDQSSANVESVYSIRVSDTKLTWG